MLVSEIILMDNDTRNTYLNNLLTTRKDYKAQTKEAWVSMMTTASLGRLVELDVITFLIVEAMYSNEGATEKNKKKVDAFRERYLELVEVELSPSTFISKVLTPAKNLSKNIVEWINSSDVIKNKLGGSSNLNKIYKNAAVAKASVN